MYLNDTLGCHDASTEVLTDKGWQAWPDYDGKSLLGTMNQATGLLEFQAPRALIRYDYDGKMYFADHKSLDFCLTPNHRMLQRPYVIPRPYFAGGAGYGMPAFATIDSLTHRSLIPASTSGFLGAEFRSIKIGDRTWGGNDLIRLLALVISDGYASGGESNRDRISFCCFREDRYDMVAKFAASIGATQFPSRKGVWVLRDGALADWIRGNCYTGPILRSPFKRVPDFVKSAAQSQIEEFLIYFGDQSLNEDRESRQFFSSSQRLIDDLQELLLRVGRRSGIYSRPQRDGGYSVRGKRILATEGHLDITLNEWRQRDTGLSILRKGQKANLRDDYYKGEVFCAEVPNSTLVTRRNGQVLISGNCCVIAGAAHMIQQWNYYAGRKTTMLTDQDVLKGYEAVGGYVPGDPSTDNGCNMIDALNYWRKTGFGGHKIVAYVALDPTKPQELFESILMFGNAYLGLALPLSCQNETAWTVPSGGAFGNGSPGSWGGHCVPVMAASPKSRTNISWGGKYKMSPNFEFDYCDEAYAVLSPDWLEANAKSPSGFDLAGLMVDLKLVTA
jgi:hypothetical protein